MQKPKVPVLTLALLMIFTTSCRRDHFRVNTSGIKVEIDIKRLEIDLFSANPAKLIESIPSLNTRYDGFLKYFGSVIKIDEKSDSLWVDGLTRFCTDKMNNQIYNAVIERYPDINDLEKQLADGFKHYRYYFPEKTIPGIYTFISGFNYSIITADSVLGIGLDKYLGSENKFYPALGIYKYQTVKMNSWNIVPDCMYAWATKVWDIKDTGYKEDNVLAEIIHEGKLLYFVKSMLPELPENLVFGFTPDQLKFCVNNEGQMWQYLVENNLLFSTDQLTKRKLINEAPFTSYFTRESPGKAATWLGFRIIDLYMQNSKGLTLGNMMKETDIQGILEKARYSPR
jgi:hypothetical protein